MVSVQHTGALFRSKTKKQHIEERPTVDATQGRRMRVNKHGHKRCKRADDDKKKKQEIT